jgi:hypothetical protein
VTIWDHLLPPFDTWWPNIVASLVWAVPGLLMHLHTRRRLKVLHAKHDELRSKISASGGDTSDWRSP